MARLRKTVYEERHALPAILTTALYIVPFQEQYRQFWPFNEWELLNQSTQELGLRKNQDSNTEIPIPSGRGKAEDYENGINFSSMSIRNNGGGTAAASTAILVVRKVVEIEVL